LSSAHQTGQHTLTNESNQLNTYNSEKKKAYNSEKCQKNQNKDTYLAHVQVRLCLHPPSTSLSSSFRTFVVRLSLYDAMLAGIFKLKPFSNWSVSLFTITETAHATLPFSELPKLPMPHHQLIHVSRCNLEQALLVCQIIIFDIYMWFDIG